ncbi:hypothetical protein GCM10023194_44160 [Planotetraspora phitsanulokensis]|uniref:DUF5667 domain-containing protein n=1 Tax=Planotetraspora phitsanulokensis TaxID=575192 RepID=A0A8J3U3N1_9ACTN|nr:DUF5667 domain-containing protein [Planotetraspora phitsanulokensis]GII38018.1 hypothetical protein Pph01_30210 [Planotetraspora phitsanulokensis]
MSCWRASRRLRGRKARGGEVPARLAELSVFLSGPSPEFRASLREELLRTHVEERVPASEPPAERPRVRRRSLFTRVRPGLVFGVLLIAMYGTGIRTYHSVPGEPLYPLKRAAESTLLSMASDEERAHREMGAARLRAAETASLAGYSTPDPGRDELIKRTLEDMESKTRAALGLVKRHGEATSTEAQRFAREQRDAVESLIPKLDGANRKKARKYLKYIDMFAFSER